MPALDAIQHVFEGRAIEVCHVGPITAVKVQLDRGSILVKLPTDRWLEKKASPADDNGRPWQTSSGRIAEVVSFAPAAPSDSRSEEEQQALLEQAWQRYTGPASPSLMSVARELDLTELSVINYFREKHSIEYDVQRGIRAEARAALTAANQARRAEREKHIDADALSRAFDEYESGSATLEELCTHFGLCRSNMMLRLERVRAQRNLPRPIAALAR